MATSTSTLKINAAFLQDIKDDNVLLNELLDSTSKALEKIDCGRIQYKALANLLGRLRDQLATHFSLEEFFGYFDDAIDSAPRLSDVAKKLRAQHDVLYLKITDLAEDAELLSFVSTNSSAYAIGSLADRFRTFHRQLQQHEESERELIMSAFYDDIGCGD